jgi:hypothetical protein
MLYAAHFVVTKKNIEENELSGLALGGFSGKKEEWERTNIKGGGAE